MSLLELVAMFVVFAVSFWYGRRADLIARQLLVIERYQAKQVETIKGSVVAGVVAAQVAGKLNEKQAATLLGFTLVNYRRHRNTVFEAAMQLHRSKQ